MSKIKITGGGKMKRNSYSDSEKQQAKMMSTIDYLNRQYSFTFQFKNNYYKCDQHDSLIIYSDGRGWVWNSHGIKGSDVIQFLKEYEGKNYVDALEILLGEPQTNTHKYVPAIAVKKEGIEFHLPEREPSKYSRVFAYLRYTRKIDEVVINDCMKNKSLYQDTRGNCVFVGFEEKNSPAYAAIRGTLTSVKYRGEIAGSNKQYNFNMTLNDNSNTLYVFESPIDCMSHASIVNHHFGNDSAYKAMNRLSLGGLSTIALDKYLELHPNIDTINFCLDNDCNAKRKDGTPAENHGQVFAKKCCKNYEERGYKTRNICPKNKDFNDELINRYMKTTYKKQTLKM